VNMLNADAQANHLWRNTGVALFLRRHLPVRRRRRVAGQRLGVAEIHQSADELQRIVEAYGGFGAALDSKRHQRATLTVEILPRHRVVWAVGKTCVFDPTHTRVSAQKLGRLTAVLDVALDAQGRGLDSL